jgi:hypothetical protein
MHWATAIFDKDAVPVAAAIALGIVVFTCAC